MNKKNDEFDENFLEGNDIEGELLDDNLSDKELIEYLISLDESDIDPATVISQDDLNDLFEATEITQNKPATEGITQIKSASEEVTQNKPATEEITQIKSATEGITQNKPAAEEVTQIKSADAQLNKPELAVEQNHKASTDISKPAVDAEATHGDQQNYVTANKSPDNIIQPVNTNSAEKIDCRFNLKNIEITQSNINTEVAKNNTGAINLFSNNNNAANPAARTTSQPTQTAEHPVQPSIQPVKTADPAVLPPNNSVKAATHGKVKKSKKRLFTRTFLLLFLSFMIFFVGFLTVSIKQTSIFGYKLVTVSSSNSQTSEMDRGDLLLVKVSEGSEEYDTKDVIAYTPNSLNTHDEGQLEYLKENSNELNIGLIDAVYPNYEAGDETYYAIETNEEDTENEYLVPQILVEGEVAHNVPYIGYPVLFCMENLYTSIVIISFLFVLSIVLFGATFKKNKKQKKSKDK